MATQLSPEVLAMLRAQQGSRTGLVNGGMNYNSLTSYGEGDNSQTAIGGSGYGVDAVGSDPRSGMYQQYDADGNYIADRAKHKDKWLQDLITAAGGALGAYGIGTAMAGAAGGLGGAVGGPGSAGWGMDLGFDAASGSLGSGAASSAASVAGPGMPGWGADLGMAGTAGTVGLPAAASAGGIPSLTSLLGGTGGYLGPAATIIGGLLGAKGNEASTSTQNKTDPRLDPFVYGEGGLLGRVQAQLQNPQTNTQGMNLLSQPVAGNGFGKVTLRK